MTTLSPHASPVLRHHQRHAPIPSNFSSLRYLSSNAGKENASGDEKKKDAGAEDEPTSDLAPLTPGEQVVLGTRLIGWGALFVLACFCAYYIVLELFPTKMSPNSVFNKASELVKEHPDVQRRFGPPFKTYGKDYGGHREGRRNFVENTQYTAEDNSKRTRIRFNLEGRFGAAVVFAEVSATFDDMVYVLVQDRRDGRIITVVDNRSALRAAQLAGTSKEGQAAFAKLLGGGDKKN